MDIRKYFPTSSNYSMMEQDILEGFPFIKYLNRGWMGLGQECLYGFLHRAEKLAWMVFIVYSNSYILWP